MTKEQIETAIVCAEQAWYALDFSEKIRLLREGYGLDPIYALRDALAAFPVVTPPQEKQCIHGHTVRTIGCVSCVLLFQSAVIPNADERDKAVRDYKGIASAASRDMMEDKT